MTSGSPRSAKQAENLRRSRVRRDGPPPGAVVDGGHRTSPALRCRFSDSCATESRQRTLQSLARSAAFVGQRSISTTDLTGRSAGTASGAVRRSRCNAGVTDQELLDEVRRRRAAGASPKDIARSLGVRPARSRATGAPAGRGGACAGARTSSWAAGSARAGAAICSSAPARAGTTSTSVRRDRRAWRWFSSRAPDAATRSGLRLSRRHVLPGRQERARAAADAPARAARFRPDLLRGVPRAGAAGTARARPARRSRRRERSRPGSASSRIPISSRCASSSAS